MLVSFGAGAGLEGGEDGDVDIDGRKVGTAAGADLDGGIGGVTSQASARGGAAQTTTGKQSVRRGESLAIGRRQRPPKCRQDETIDYFLHYVRECVNDLMSD